MHSAQFITTSFPGTVSNDAVLPRVHEEREERSRESEFSFKGVERGRGKKCMSAACAVLKLFSDQRSPERIASRRSSQRDVASRRKEVKKTPSAR